MITYLVNENSKQAIEVLDTGLMFMEGNLFTIEGQEAIATKVVYAAQLAGDKASLTQLVYLHKVLEEIKPYGKKKK